MGKHACWYATGRTPYLGSARVENRGTGMLKEHPGQESMIVTMTGFASGLHTLCSKTRFKGPAGVSSDGGTKNGFVIFHSRTVNTLTEPVGSFP